MQIRREPAEKPSLHRAAPQTTGRVTSHDLLGIRREIVIEHQGRDYRLRVTRSGKLILTA
jgi:hemin uptake protein HemP